MYKTISVVVSRRELYNAIDFKLSIQPFNSVSFLCSDHTQEPLSPYSYKNEMYVNHKINTVYDDLIVLKLLSRLLILYISVL